MKDELKKVLRYGKEDEIAEIIEDPEIIIKYVHLGTSLPVLPEFHKYILGDIIGYNAKAIFLRKNIRTQDCMPQEKMWDFRMGRWVILKWDIYI